MQTQEPRIARRHEQVAGVTLSDIKADMAAVIKAVLTNTQRRMDREGGWQAPDQIHEYRNSDRPASFAPRCSFALSPRYTFIFQTWVFRKDSPGSASRELSSHSFRIDVI